MEENCSIKLFESDLESMLSQVLAKARSRDEKLKAAKEKAVELKHQNEKLNAVLDLKIARHPNFSNFLAAAIIGGNK